MDNIKPEEWVNARMVKQPTFKPRIEPQVDKELSNLVGTKVFANDARLIKKLVEWKRTKDQDKPDNFLKDPNKISELKKIFNG